MIRRYALTAMLAVVTTVTGTDARAQGHVSPVPAPPRAPAAVPDKHGTAKPATPEKPATGTNGNPQVNDLKSALERIDREIKQTTHTTADTPRAGVHPPSAVQPSSPVHPPAAAPERIHLSWRVALTWPSEIAIGSAVAGDGRVSLSWR